MSETDREQFEGMSGAELMALGISLYNGGSFFEAHEAWEEVWLEAETAEREFYQGLIQITAAFVHVTRNEYPGSVRLLDAGIAKLARYGERKEGIELRAFVEGARRARESLLALGERRLREFDRGLIPRIDLTPTPLHGDGEGSS
jgi:predicted metal-dependent hydrolase